MTEPIDVVYTWVDAAEPGFRDRLARHAGASGAGQRPDAFRFRDNGELRYSLRSLQRHAPWTGRIHFVTDGAVPDWLNLDVPDIRWVTHAQIFRNPEDLPTFNSHAIEANLHRIPGLSRRFLYLNDDLFLGRDCTRSDYLEGDRGTVYLDAIDLDRDLDADQASDHACLATRALVARVTGAPPLRWMPAHAPQLVDQALVRKLETMFPEAFAATSAQRFRSAGDFVLRIAHAMLAIARDDRCVRLVDGSDDYRFLRMTPGLWRRWRDFAEIRLRHPKFLCINDELGVGWRDRRVAAIMRSCLARCHPAPCRFERTPNPS